MMVSANVKNLQNYLDLDQNDYKENNKIEIQDFISERLKSKMVYKFFDSIKNN